MPRETHRLAVPVAVRIYGFAHHKADEAALVALTHDPHFTMGFSEEFILGPTRRLDWAEPNGTSHLNDRPQKSPGEILMHRYGLLSLALAAAMTMAFTAAQAHDEFKYPDWAGQWRCPPGVNNQWDPDQAARSEKASTADGGIPGHL